MSKRCNTCKQFLPEQVNFYIDKELDMKFKQKLPEKSYKRVNASCPVGLECEICPLKKHGYCKESIIMDVEVAIESEKKDKLKQLLSNYGLCYLGDDKEIITVSLQDYLANSIYELFEKEVVPRKKEIDTLLPQNSGATISQMAYAFNRCVDEIQENLSRMKGE